MKKKEKKRKKFLNQHKLNSVQKIQPTPKRFNNNNILSIFVILLKIIKITIILFFIIIQFYNAFYLNYFTR